MTLLTIELLCPTFSSHFIKMKTVLKPKDLLSAVYWPYFIQALADFMNGNRSCSTLRLSASFGGLSFLVFSKVKRVSTEHNPFN